MASKNGETRQCANTNRVSMSVISEKTNMNIVATSDFNFHGINLQPVENINGTWLTSADVAKALGYKSTKSISNLFAQYDDEFSQGMTMVIESVTNGINGSSRRMKVRVFSLRGAHLIAMFARTPAAKEFRRWVLDILDREVARGNVNPAFDFEMYVHNANVAYIHMSYIHEVWMQELHPALKRLGSPLAVKLYDRINDATAIVGGVKHGLEKASGLKGLQH
ncbi:BRO family, N-terminal domain [Serratia ficaria]|uniref:BRO-N domain-containing protein n=1 Tax=Serratia ficaria TaxID=61651 RepID=UPI00217BD4F8|nr:Bro-N domain-containing protein [Serratia ficaria]CAI2000765.1 BRO family, N-terminal domain [Serratia ficaria]CAI2081885.1 BRO family, N-terminal domain [Serratia ficaria]CAI2491459.1 BRO family, N-terminal domain [Serratia ficaria]